MAASGCRGRTGEGGEAPFSEIYLALRELSCHKRRTVGLLLPRHIGSTCLEGRFLMFWFYCSAKINFDRKLPTRPLTPMAAFCVSGELSEPIYTEVKGVPG
jgi:hypothetical protein